jgi:hypothetical protein
VGNRQLVASSTAANPLIMTHHSRFFIHENLLCTFYQCTVGSNQGCVSTCCCDRKPIGKSPRDGDDSTLPTPSHFVTNCKSRPRFGFSRKGLINRCFPTAVFSASNEALHAISSPAKSWDGTLLSSPNPRLAHCVARPMQSPSSRQNRPQMLSAELPTLGTEPSRKWNRILNARENRGLAMVMVPCR